MNRERMFSLPGRGATDSQEEEMLINSVSRRLSDEEKLQLLFLYWYIRRTLANSIEVKMAVGSEGIEGIRLVRSISFNEPVHPKIISMEALPHFLREPIQQGQLSFSESRVKKNKVLGITAAGAGMFAAPLLMLGGIIGIHSSGPGEALASKVLLGMGGGLVMIGIIALGLAAYMYFAYTKEIVFTKENLDRIPETEKQRYCDEGQAHFNQQFVFNPDIKKEFEKVGIRLEVHENFIERIRRHTAVPAEARVTSVGVSGMKMA